MRVVVLLATWIAGVAIWATGHGWGLALAGVGACGLLLLAWHRGANYLPDGGGPLGPLGHG